MNAIHCTMYHGTLYCVHCIANTSIAFCNIRKLMPIN